MRWFRLVVLAAVGTVMVAGPAFAWRCPLEWRTAEEAIRKAEALNLPAEARALVAEAKRLVAESKKHHEGTAKIEHAHSMWKARAALAQAEAAAVLATP